MAGYYFDLKRSGDQFMFNLKAGNHETVLTSERYTTKANAQKGIDSVKANSPTDARYERKASGSQFMFNLKAANGEVIGTSERYTTEAARENTITQIKANAPTAEVKDNT